MADNDDTTGDHVHRGYIGPDYFATADDGTRVIEFVDVDPANVRVFYHGGTYHLVPDDSAVGSAGDRMLGPDNPVPGVSATDNDG